MHKGFIRISALLGALTVILGAFAAHQLKRTYGPEELAIFETAVKYQFYHLLALMFTGMLYREFNHKLMIWAGRLFLAGIVIFSGSLYLLSAAKASGSASFNWLGAVTPFGGTAFIAGWICLFMAVSKKN